MSNFILKEIKSGRIININKNIDGGWFWPKYSASPYIGCTNNCSYCFLKQKSYKFFNKQDGKLLIKVIKNAVNLFRKELSALPKNTIIIGEYQPVEAEYKLLRGMLEVCLELEFPVVIITKSPLVLRDVDILKKYQKKSESELYSVFPITAQIIT